jgi:hypothetical protein
MGLKNLADDALVSILARNQDKNDSSQEMHLVTAATLLLHAAGEHCHEGPRDCAFGVRQP